MEISEGWFNITSAKESKKRFSFRKWRKRTNRDWPFIFVDFFVQGIGQPSKVIVSSSASVRLAIEVRVRRLKEMWLMKTWYEFSETSDFAFNFIIHIGRFSLSVVMYLRIRHFYSSRKDFLLLVLSFETTIKKNSSKRQSNQLHAHLLSHFFCLA